VDLSADTLVYWAPQQPAKASAAVPIQRPDAGFTVLRSRWQRDGAYALLQHEQGVARIGGVGREHPDALVFLWAARGHCLLLDSGYGYYEVHEAVNQPEAHNGVLIDGEGSWHVDAFAEDAGMGDDLQWATATTSFGGVDWQRSVVLLGESALLVVDRLEPNDGQAHDYTLVLHGPSMDFAMEAGLVRWGAGELELQLTMLGAPTGQWSPRAAQHGFTRTLEDHTALDVTVPDSGAITLVTLALAVRDGDDAIVSDDASARWSQGSVTADGRLDWRGESWSF